MRFSERIGKKDKKVDIQIDSIDLELRNGLWNVFSIIINQPMNEYAVLERSPFKGLIESIYIHFLKEPVDEIPYAVSEVIKELRSRFFNWDYLNVYDFIDFIGRTEDEAFDPEEFRATRDIILKRELSAYRFVSGQLAPITSEIEIHEIEEAIESSANQNFNGVRIHLESALTKLSDKTKPDYRNSIKESISAVESICQEITNDKNAELGKTIKKLRTIIPIHGALEQGFIKLYGWTSDSDGIRHAMMEDDNLDQEDALFMLVSCSAFINYLIAKATKLG